MRKDIIQKFFWQSVLIANFYAVFFIWYLGSGELLKSGIFSDGAIALGRLTGLVLELLILLELVLISRALPLERLYGFDKTNALHRKIGYFLLCFIFAHPILLTLGYAARTGRSVSEQFLSFLLHWEDVASACIALFIFAVVGVLALPRIRRALSYEFWYFTHLPLYGAIVLAFDHQTRSGDVSSGGALYYWLMLNFFVFGVVLVYRFLVPLYKNLKHQFRVVRVVRESGDITSVYIGGKHMETFYFEAGQFARLIFFQKGMWQGHPFSFSAPCNGKELRFSIKALGDWTQRASELRTGTRVWLEGPLGTFTLRKARTKKLLFIAGGIGITPILAMIRSIVRGTDALLFYGVRKQSALIFLTELEKAGVPIRAFLSEETESREYEQGIITASRIAALCPDLNERDVYLCGPPSMMNVLVRDLPRKGVSPDRLHFEKFSF